MTEVTNQQQSRNSENGAAYHSEYNIVLYCVEFSYIMIFFNTNFKLGVFFY